MWILVLGDIVKNFVKNVKQYCMVLSKIKCHILYKTTINYYDAQTKKWEEISEQKLWEWKMLFSYNSLLCDKLINQENKVTWKLQFAITWHYQMQLKTILSHCYLIGISAGMNSPWNLGQIRWTWGLGQYAMRTPESFSWENKVTMVLFINRQMPLQWWWTWWSEQRGSRRGREWGRWWWGCWFLW